MVARKKVIKNGKTLLTKPKDVFRKELEERISVGEKIFKGEINNNEQFEKAQKEFSKWSDYNLELLKQSFSEPYNEYWRGYDNCDNGIGLLEALGVKSERSNQISHNFKTIVESKLDNLIKLKDKLNLIDSTIKNSSVMSKVQTERNMSQVFIVHGHDEEAKAKTARFVENLGFKAIILHEQASSSRSIIEKIEEYSNVGFGIVLYTPCDIGGKQSDEPELKPRARQNVVFEHGFLIGKIKRQNVCALVKGDVELPNDISGVVYIQMDSGGSWKYAVAKEMKASGYNIDMNKI